MGKKVRIKSPLLNLMERVILHVHYQKYLKKKKTVGRRRSAFLFLYPGDSAPTSTLYAPREGRCLRPPGQAFLAPGELRPSLNLGSVSSYRVTCSGMGDIQKKSPAFADHA